MQLLIYYKAIQGTRNISKCKLLWKAKCKNNQKHVILVFPAIIKRWLYISFLYIIKCIMSQNCRITHIHMHVYKTTAGEVK